MRRHDRLGRVQPRNPFADTMVLIRAFPEVALAFEKGKRVPASYITEGGVRCRCGSRTPLSRGMIAECAGKCGRWFCRVGRDDVRSARTR
jgi:hypothetical protein